MSHMSKFKERLEESIDLFFKLIMGQACFGAKPQRTL